MKHAGSLEVHTNRTMHRNIREDRIYIDGNTARKLQTVPTRRNTKQNDAIKRQQVRRRIKLSPMNFGYIFFMMVAMLVVCVVLIGYVELQADITNRINQISKLERQLNDLRLENDEIYTKIMSEVDLEEIKKIAINELGMKYAKEGIPKVLHGQTNGYLPKLIVTENNEDEALKILSYVKQYHMNGTPLKEMAVICRWASQSTNLEVELNKAGVPFKKFGGLKKKW